MIALGLGSSDANGLDYLRQGIRELKRLPGLKILRTSPVYRSDAMLPPGAPAAWATEYLNLAVSCDANGTPEEWLERYKALEIRLGRRKRERWAPREIDVDILAWGNAIHESANLRIPHPGLLERPFALLPLADIAPDWVHPARGARASELARPWRNSPVPFRTERTTHCLTELVGILNLTPDSFSDGGELAHSEKILERGEQLLSEGAAILDVGAESTRPGAAEVPPHEELARLEAALPALNTLKSRHPRLKLSLDSRRAAVARAALERYPWDWLNDVTGFSDPEMIRLARDSPRIQIVAMHSLGIPPAREATLPLDRDPVAELLAWGGRKLEEFSRSGIDSSRVILDPGIGFGKTAAQSWRVLGEARRLHGLPVPWLIGHSRKSFLVGVTDRAPRERDLETALITARLSEQGIEYARVHDGATNGRALRFQMAYDGVSRWDET